MDNEFEVLKPLIPTLMINTTAAKEHVPEIKHRIRLIKERGRGILNTLPFRKKMPKLMLIELIYHVVLWLNAFPVRSGVSATLSPQELIIRQQLDFQSTAELRLAPTAKCMMSQLRPTEWNAARMWRFALGPLATCKEPTSSSVFGLVV